MTAPTQPPARSRRGLWAAWAAGAALAVSVALAAFSGEQFARRHAGLRDPAELPLLPSGPHLGELTLGRRHLLADLAWLTAIQYYGRHRLTDRRYPLTGQLFRVITDCDPQFANAYLFGALILAEAGEADAAAALLAKGVAANPQSWMLAFELGFLHYAYTQRWPEALEAFMRAVRLPGCPDYVARFAAAAGERAQRPELAAELWAMIARDSPNEEVRRIALERLAALEAAAGPEPREGGRMARAGGGQGMAAPE